jgi:hypothetical protein
MNKRKILIGALAAVVATVTFFSCKKETKVNTDGGNLYQPYVPYQIGKYVIYDVDSSLWDDNLCLKVSRKCQMEYLVSDTFRDGQNRLSYVVDVLSRKNDTAQFASDYVLYVTPGAEQYEFVEKNIRFMRMVNPVKNGYSWSGNSLMPADDQDYAYLKNWNYQYQDVLQPYSTNKLTFPNTVTVSETNQVLNNPETKPDAYAYMLISKTVYAYEVGMVYHEYTNWTYDPTVPGVKACRKGSGVIMQAVEHN